jgi:hypothetical protein
VIAMFLLGGSTVVWIGRFVACSPRLRAAPSKRHEVEGVYGCIAVRLWLLPTLPYALVMLIWEGRTRHVCNTATGLPAPSPARGDRAESSQVVGAGGMASCLCHDPKPLHR